MEWDANTEKLIRDQARKNNSPLPDSIANKPYLKAGLPFYYQAFVYLDTCRAIGMGPGRIPWTAMNEYAREQDLDQETRERLFYLIKSMDDAYLDHMDKKRTRDRDKSLKKR